MSKVSALNTKPVTRKQVDVMGKEIESSFSE